MPIKNIQFNSFKPYSHYLKNEENNFKKNMPNPKALVGAAAGVLCGMKIAPVLIKKGKIKEVLKRNEWYTGCWNYIKKKKI